MLSKIYHEILLVNCVKNANKQLLIENEFDLLQQRGVEQRGRHRWLNTNNHNGGCSALLGCGKLKAKFSFSLELTFISIISYITI